MTRIRFNYFFRDADNYKLFGSEVFSNEEGLTLAVIEKSIKSLLIDRQFFYPLQWNLPAVDFRRWMGMEEMDWCEFEGVEEAEDVNAVSKFTF
ncbi:MAG: hypothetical protein WDO15_14785 [Bacteroidota bacterium]